MDRTVLSDRSGEPRYRQVFVDLRRDIEAGKYKPGQKLPSEAALVQRFRTSRITVGRALRELKEQGLVVGVAGSGNYVRHVEAPASELVFGLLIPNLGETDIFEPICRGMASAPEAHALLWGSSTSGEGDIEKQALELCRQFIGRNVSGVFFAPLEFTANKDAVNAQICLLIDRAGIPLVLLDRCIEKFPRRSRYDLVGIDNRRAGYLAAEHLLRLGCGDVAFLGPSDAAPTVSARMAGYREALVAHGVNFLPNRVQVVNSTDVESLMGAFDRAASKAFVCANDRLAAELIQALSANGHPVPGEVRVVGMDDVGYAHLLPVPLTTIHQPCREIGQAAIAAMIERRKNSQMPARDILLSCHLVVRESSGRER